MNYNRKKLTLKFLCVALFYLNVGWAQGVKIVATPNEFETAVNQVKPGDTIKLSNGIWKDAELLFRGKGTKNNPIVLTAEKKGQVFLEGQSNLRLSGEFLVVSGLVFRNGYTATNEVISFKENNDKLANHCRLTDCVIDNYSNPERHEQDTWVAIYGKHNQVDHNHLEGKGNGGVTMIVRLNSKLSQENEHIIEYNYFGPRENLGSNGGETLRIGTSHFSLTNSRTLVHNNYFDRCNGEHEIISNKSGANIYRGNVFFECTGTLTMRHGSGTIVENNVFLGNHKPSTGGIRVINSHQTVRNNYGYGLTGYRFRGAFVIMNGVPNSPINRYHQVVDAKIENNTFIDCDHIQLCAGSDKERSATPKNSAMQNNIFYHEKNHDLFTVYDDISGITFSKNIVAEHSNLTVLPHLKAKKIKWIKGKNGLWQPKSKLKEGVRFATLVVTKKMTGTSWYLKNEPKTIFNSGKVMSVKPGLNTLYNAFKQSKAGDILELESGQLYETSKTIEVTHPITMRSLGKAKPKMLFEKKALFDIQNGGSLSLKHILFDGENAPDGPGNAVIRTSRYSMNKNYKLFIDDCDFVNLDVNYSFDVIRVSKNTFADSISVVNSRFQTVSGNVMALDKEIDDIGIYNAEYVILKNNIFKDIGGVVLSLYRGGKDESTFGPFLYIDHCVFDHVGHGKKNKLDAAIRLYGVQVIDVKNNIFNETKPIQSHLVVGDPIVNIVNNNFQPVKNVKMTGDQKFHVENNWVLKNGFKSGDGFMLSDKSLLKEKGTDGKDLGIMQK